MKSKKLPTTILGTLASGEQVIDRPISHLQGEVTSLLSEVLGKITSEKRDQIVELVDLSRVVGKRICVETKPSDKIVFAKRPFRKGVTRFVLDREPEDCSTVRVVLKKSRDPNLYLCLTAFIGIASEPEPWDYNATPQSESFWEKHALIWGETEVIPESMFEVD